MPLVPLKLLLELLMNSLVGKINLQIYETQEYFFNIKMSYDLIIRMKINNVVFGES